MHRDSHPCQTALARQTPTHPRPTTKDVQLRAQAATKRARTAITLAAQATRGKEPCFCKQILLLGIAHSMTCR
eukprot:126163-Amphidinium_carterae.1